MKREAIVKGVEYFITSSRHYLEPFHYSHGQKGTLADGRRWRHCEWKYAMLGSRIEGVDDGKRVKVTNADTLDSKGHWLLFKMADTTYSKDNYELHLTSEVRGTWEEVTKQLAEINEKAKEQQANREWRDKIDKARADKIVADFQLYEINAIRYSCPAKSVVYQLIITLEDAEKLLERLA
jgi:hypothetical protein